MTWETVIGGALQGISNFVQSLVSIVGGSFTPEAGEGIIALFAIGFLIRLFDGGRSSLPKLPKLPKKKEDDDEYEYIMVRRKK